MRRNYTGLPFTIVAEILTDMLSNCLRIKSSPLVWSVALQAARCLWEHSIYSATLLLRLSKRCSPSGEESHKCIFTEDILHLKQHSYKHQSKIPKVNWSLGFVPAPSALLRCNWQITVYTFKIYDVLTLCTNVLWNEYYNKAWWLEETYPSTHIL